MSPITVPEKVFGSLLKKDPWNHHDYVDGPEDSDQNEIPRPPAVDRFQTASDGADRVMQIPVGVRTTGENVVV